MLLRRGYEGAFVIFTDRETDRFVQIRKYIRAPGCFGLEMHFPRVKWSEPYYANAQRTMTQMGLQFSHATSEEGNGGHAFRPG